MAVTSHGQHEPVRHFRYVNKILKRLAHGNGGRVIVPWPRRHGKSTFCSHYNAAWFLGTFPDRRIILASYESDLATYWGRQVRNTFEEWAPHIWGLSVDKNRSAASDWAIAGHRGGMRSVGIGGGSVGFGCDLLIIDDFCKNAEQAMSAVYRERVWEWYKSSARPCLEPGGRVLIPNTRWHEEDLVGKLLAEREDKWEIVRLPAIAEEDDPLERDAGEALWPSRIPIEELEEIRLDMGPMWFDAEYQQVPQPEGGSEWPAAWFADRPGLPFWFDEWPTTLNFRLMALDPSKGADDKAGDYSAWVLLGKSPNGTLYVDADLDRRNIIRIIEDGVELYKGFGPCDGVACESNQFQELIANDFEKAMRRENLTWHRYDFHNHVPKVTRIRRLTPLLSRGKIRFKKDSRGAKLLVSQLKQFSNGEYDDGPDALEMAVRVLQQIEMRGKGRPPQQRIYT